MHECTSAFSGTVGLQVSQEREKRRVFSWWCFFRLKVGLGVFPHANVSSFSGQPPLDSWILLLTFSLGFPVSFCPQRHTLWKRVQSVITPFLALLIAVIDRNGNLDLLVRPTAEWVTNLWMFIFSDTKLLTVPYGVAKNR